MSGFKPILALLLATFVAAKVLPINEEDQLLYEVTDKNQSLSTLSITLSSITFQNFARKGVEKFNQQSNDIYKWELDRTWEVERKLSGGIHYSIFVTLVKTDCKKGEEERKCRKTDTLKVME